MTPARFTNRLAHETSLYLKQHQHNPVDWYPWGPEAIERARELDRPIFLSIGYSACHWCHVMERESFENEEIAAILNEHFVSIKVDREERPDLDQIYMTAVQMLNNGQGGWPMSVFLTPDLKPFTGGTYFPPEDRYGRPGFKRVLLTIAEWWKTRRPEIDAVADDLTQHLREARTPEAGEGPLDESLLRGAVQQLARAFDRTHGGFGSAPKFPHPMDLRMLLRAWKRLGDDNALHMVRLTLEKMAMGGIYDHLGGGFARYSTDARWLAPHFEKMLYDNALLVSSYLDAYQATGEPLFRDVVIETLGWIEREMTSPEGPFYSTLDADSEGEEGKFYVWSQAEIERLLGDDAALFAYAYGVEPGGNWEGRNILHRTKTFDQIARVHSLGEAEVRERLARGRAKLFEARGGRVRPGRDEKMLTSWNGLMIAALAQAARVLDQPRYAQAAARAADFILDRMRTPEGLLLHSYSSGSAPRFNGYLEDYAYFIDSLVSLYQADFDPRWVAAALDLAAVMAEQFWDDAEGGFFYTGRDHEPLIARNKELHDNATPSSTAMAVTAMLRLFKLTGKPEFWEKAERTLRLSRGLMAEHPTAMGQMLIALDFYLGPVKEVAIVGDPASDDVRRLLRGLYGKFLPNKVVALLPPGAPESVKEILPLLADKESKGEVTTYVCENFACKEPLVGVDAALAALQDA